MPNRVLYVVACPHPGRAPHVAATEDDAEWRAAACSAAREHPDPVPYSPRADVIEEAVGRLREMLAGGEAPYRHSCIEECVRALEAMKEGTT